MDPEDFIQMINVLTRGRVQDADTAGFFAQSLAEAFRAVEEGGLQVFNYFQENSEEINRQEPLMDQWLAAICFAMFVQGIAIGRGSEQQVQIQDIRIARANICDKWPDCERMRLSDFLNALDIMRKQP
jgi:hypothetical protein